MSGKTVCTYRCMTHKSSFSSAFFIEDFGICVIGTEVGLTSLATLVTSAACDSVPNTSSSATISSTSMSPPGWNWDAISSKVRFLVSGTLRQTNTVKIIMRNKKMRNVYSLNSFCTETKNVHDTIKFVLCRDKFKQAAATPSQQYGYISKMTYKPSKVLPSFWFVLRAVAVLGRGRKGAWAPSFQPLTISKYAGNLVISRHKFKNTPSPYPIPLTRARGQAPRNFRLEPPLDQSSSVGLCMHHYKSLCVAVTICAILVNTQTDRQLLTIVILLAQPVALKKDIYNT